MFVVVTVFLLCVSDTSGNMTDQKSDVPSGVKLRLTTSGLRYLAGMKVIALEKKMVTGMQTLSGEQGNVKYRLEVIIKKFQVKRYSTTPEPNNGLKLVIEGIDIHAFGDLSTKGARGWSELDPTNRLKVTAKGIKLVFTKTIEAKNGKPFAKLISCKPHIGPVGIHYQGSVSWWNDVSREFMSNKLKTIWGQQMCKHVSYLVNNTFTKVLQQFPVRENVTDYVYIDFSFQDALFTDQYMDLNFRGQFFDSTKPVKSSLAPPQFDTSHFGSSKMVSVWISDYFLNTAGDVLHNSKLLNRLINPRLSTNRLALFIPQLYVKYPSRPIKIRLETFSAPRFHVRPEGATVELYMRAGVYVVTEDNILTRVFYIDISVDGDLTPIIRRIDKKINIGGGIASFDTDLSVGGSTIGEVNLPLDTIETIAGGFAVDQVNPLLDKGFPIPQSDCLEFTNPTLALVKNAIRIDTMIEYHTERCI